jgi:hypothetical protein
LLLTKRGTRNTSLFASFSSEKEEFLLSKKETLTSAASA